VLEREPVDHFDRLVLGQLLVGTGCLEHDPLQVPFEPGAEREVDQGPLQFRAALDERAERRLPAPVVHGPKCHVTPPPTGGRHVPGCMASPENVLPSIIGGNLGPGLLAQRC
jgi:hypothetical protein